LAVVTADGKVTAKELAHLVNTANALHTVLANLYRQKDELHLDEALCARLEVQAWADMLEEFTLPAAENENINSWIGVIDGWVNCAAAALSTLATATLEQLLHTEDEVARHAVECTQPLAAAPVPSRIPPRYVTLQHGQERKLQQRLGLWDRFQTADGIFPAIARVLVAGSIVGAVLGFGSFAGTGTTLSVYNGLGRPVVVHVGSEQVSLAPFSAGEMAVELDEKASVEAATDDGSLIERFNPPLTSHAHHYVYNVASASPMVLWTANYGSASEQPPRFLGVPRWFAASADVFFAEPPANVKTKNGGATRTVLSGLGDRSPDDVLKLVSSDAERAQVVMAHAKWDKDTASHAREWHALAGSN
jgi:hypothetical protein